ncbi:hypothetical protein DAI22_03g211000 [Oryza sativa Japonica Group]|nr:hypothetical protein DAI22_03g211000 [Oryza sativa Japonica Group]
MRTARRGRASAESYYHRFIIASTCAATGSTGVADLPQPNANLATQRPHPRQPSGHLRPSTGDLRSLFTHKAVDPPPAANAPPTAAPPPSSPSLGQINATAVAVARIPPPPPPTPHPAPPLPSILPPVCRGTPHQPDLRRRRAPSSTTICACVIHWVNMIFEPICCVVLSIISLLLSDWYILV